MADSDFRMSNIIPCAVRRLQNPSATEVRKVVGVLQAAFGVDDRFTNLLVGGNQALITPKFESNIRAGSIGGQVHVASLGPEINDVIAAAVWYGPGQASMATEEQYEVGFKRFFAKCPDTLRKWWLDHFLPSIDHLADESLGPRFKKVQWSLLLFGVAPEHRRKGVAKTMIPVVEEKAKADDVSIVLETTTDLNLLIYQRMGFEVKGKVIVTSPLGQSPVYQLMETP